MKSIFMVMALLATSTGAQAAAADPDMQFCRETRDKVSQQGISYDLNIEAVNVFDTSDRESKSIQLQIIPASMTVCDNIPNAQLGFELGYDATLRSGTTNFAGRFTDPHGSIMIYNSQPEFEEIPELQVHSSVVAALLKQLGFATYETADANSFISLPFYMGSQDQPVIGTAGVDGKVYQVTLKSVAYRFPQ